MLSASILLSVVTAQSSKDATAYAARVARAEKAYTDANNGKSPTVSGFKLHAPCDGYLDPISGRVCNGGEFLCSHGESNGKVNFYKGRILLDSAVASELRELFKLSGLNIAGSQGAHFTSDNIAKCYLYVEGEKSLVTALMDYHNETTEKAEQEKKAEQKAAKGTAPIGRQIVECRIAKITAQYSDFSYGKIDYKVFAILDNGATIYGTLPAKLIGQVEAGDTMKIKATFTQAENDNTHAFYSRPTVVA